MLMLAIVVPAVDRQVVALPIVARSAQRLGSLGIHDELELRWLLESQVARLGAAKQFVRKVRGPPKCVRHYIAGSRSRAMELTMRRR